MSGFTSKTNDDRVSAPGRVSMPVLIAGVLAACLALFHLTTSFMGTLPTMQQVYVHLGFVLAIVFITRPLFHGSQAVGKVRWVIDVPLLIMAVGVCAYAVLNYLDLSVRGAGNPSTIATVCGVALTLLLLEATRRMIGWALPLLAGVFILYAFVGPYLPMDFAHRGFGVERLAATFFVSASGIPGTPMQVSATYVATFVIFAAFLEASGAGQFFINWSYAVLGRLRGGPAKVAILASLLMGTINGSAVANTVATGTFTIPLMKRSGMKPEVAGAVEAASSSGGQLVPPVMGAAAFIMAEILGTPFSEIMVAAAIPAILYYFALFLMVDFDVARKGHNGIPRDQLPSARDIFRKGWYLPIPLVLLIVLLVFVGYTPIRSAFYATVAAFAISWVARETRMGPRRIIGALQAGGRGMLEVAVACGTAGIIIGVLMLTGLALRISGILVDLSGDSLMVLMVLTMGVSLVMGMGLPTSAVYIILATLVVPAMTQFGVEPLAAHLFVLYFGVMANVTPPVALAAYAGAAIARGSPSRTGVIAFRLSLAGFILPFCWVYNPALILHGNAWEITLAIATAMVGIVAFAAGIQGYLFRACATGLQRMLLAVGAVLAIMPGVWTDLAGIALIAIAVGLRFLLGGRPLPSFQQGSSALETQE